MFLEPLHVMIVALLALCFEGIGVKYIGCNECNYKYLVENKFVNPWRLFFTLKFAQCFNFICVCYVMFPHRKRLFIKWLSYYVSHMLNVTWEAFIYTWPQVSAYNISWHLTHKASLVSNTIINLVHTKSLYFVAYPIAHNKNAFVRTGDTIIF